MARRRVQNKNPKSKNKGQETNLAANGGNKAVDRHGTSGGSEAGLADGGVTSNVPPGINRGDWTPQMAWQMADCKRGAEI